MDDKTTDEWWVINADGLTTNWHSGGALVLKASSEEHARRKAEAWHLEDGPTSPEDPWEIYSVRRLADKEFTIFPDAGCC